jgi:hypothetical protein
MSQNKKNSNAFPSQFQTLHFSPIHKNGFIAFWNQTLHILSYNMRTVLFTPMKGNSHSVHGRRRYILTLSVPGPFYFFYPRIPGMTSFFYQFSKNCKKKHVSITADIPWLTTWEPFCSISVHGAIKWTEVFLSFETVAGIWRSIC